MRVAIASLCLVPLLFHFLGIRGFPTMESYGQILTGCLVAIALHEKAVYEWFRHRLSFPSLLAAVLVFAVVHFTAHYHRLSALAYPFAFALAMISLLLSTTALNKLVGNGLLVLLGKISYGMYLIHLITLNVAELVFPPASGNLLVSAAAYVFAVFLTASFAYLLYAFFERPLTNLGREYSRRLIQRRTR